jgi:hypothetical protein
MLTSKQPGGFVLVASSDGGKRRRRKYNLIHERFSKLEAPLTVVLVCFAHGVGTYI